MIKNALNGSTINLTLPNRLLNSNICIKFSLLNKTLNAGIEHNTADMAEKIDTSFIL